MSDDKSVFDILEEEMQAFRKRCEGLGIGFVGVLGEVRPARETNLETAHWTYTSSANVFVGIGMLRLALREFEADSSGGPE